MDDKNQAVQPPRRALEFGALVTSITLGMYVLGYFKLAALYAALDCVWVLKFNSPQDFISQGAVGVGSVVIGAIVFGRKTFAGMQRSQAIMSLIGLLALGVAAFLTKFLSLSIFLDPLMEVMPYTFYGLICYAIILSFTHDEFKNQQITFFVCALVMLAILIYLQTSPRVKELTRGLGSTYMVSKISGSDKSILVGSVNNKYLVRPCVGPVRYLIIDPGAEWVVTSIASSMDCK